MDNVHADSDTSITDVSQTIDVLTTPIRGWTTEILKKPASALNVALSEIPRFLGD